MVRARSWWSVLVGACLALASLTPAAGPVLATVPTSDPPAVAAPQALPDVDANVRAYVTQVYRDLFDRAPDPAGLDTWTTSLLSGVAYGSVANSITSSTEYRSRLITAAYQTYLGRTPDLSGLQFWLAQMTGGRHIEQMQSGFIASEEFYARGGGSVRGWVALLYQTVLGRSAGASEVEWWVSAIAGGMDRAGVALGFLYSTEHLTTVVDGYYVHLLGRHIDPSGTATWVGLIQFGHRDEEIIAGIVSSDEYRSKVPPIEGPAQHTPIHLDVTAGAQTCVGGALVGGSIGWPVPLPAGIESVQLFLGQTLISAAPAANLAPSADYSLRVQVAEGYLLSNVGATDIGGGAYQLPQQVLAFGGPCTPAPTPVSLTISARPPTCVDGALVGGSLDWDTPLPTGITSAGVFLGGRLVASGPASNVWGGTYTVWARVADGYALTNGGAVGQGGGAYSIDVYLPPYTGTLCSAPPEAARVPDAGTDGEFYPGDASISSDGGRLAFTSNAPGLVAGDTNGNQDVFVWDRQAGATVLVSAGVGGSPANGGSLEPSISADGRWVAFVSVASNLVDGDTNNVGDVFVADLTTGAVQLVSVGQGGAPADSRSSAPSISADGRWVAFASVASNLVDDEISDTQAVFVFDRSTGETRLVSVGTGGPVAGQSKFAADPSISGDGQWIAFTSERDFLTGGAQGTLVYLWSGTTGTTQLVSQGLDGAPASTSESASVSADGRWVAFGSSSANLVGSGSGIRQTVFVWDRLTGRSSPIAFEADGTLADGGQPAISADGQRISYSSWSATVAVGMRTGAADVVVADRATGATSMVSVGAGGTVPMGPSGRSLISADGEWIAFWSSAPNLVERDVNGRWDLFLTHVP